MSTRRFVDGMAVRREVLGDEYVDRALANATEFTQPLQDLVTENCWGEIWTRDALPRRTRSLVTLAMLAALKAPAELKAHVPFIGGKIEQSAADPIRTAIGIETGLLREWLAR